MSEALYTSSASFMSMGAEYRIYADRLELGCLFLPTQVIPFEELKQVAVRPPLVIMDAFRGDVPFERAAVALKMDLCDLSEHVAVLRKTGIIKQLRFAPDHPKAFVEALEAAFDAWRDAQEA